MARVWKVWLPTFAYYLKAPDLTADAAEAHKQKARSLRKLRAFLTLRDRSKPTRVTDRLRVSGEHLAHFFHGSNFDLPNSLRANAVLRSQIMECHDA